MNKGNLIVVAGPSGVGKGTVINKYVAEHEFTSVSISVTTRPIRETELDGVHYYFTTKENFKKMLDSGEIIEFTEYNGNFYGTPRKKVVEELSKGVDVICEVDQEGVSNFKSLFPDALFIFLAPPSWDELEARLIGRNTNSPEDIKRRLEIAKFEMTQQEKYDTVIVNDVIQRAAKEMSDKIADFKQNTKK